MYKYILNTNGNAKTKENEVIAISGNDYVKYMTEQVVTFMDMPRNERKSRRKHKKSDVSLLSNKWLGVLPFALKMFMKKTN
ncbi:YqzE family protein [Virgibacillus oceani]|uniref:YqzE family protein n=1 Tax=Virgibacillus oceani TaxID=1479511 RepID=A0A917H0T6_9BACI|nr:YqzE family protein [Virgibacillus oceani]GGG63787.1 hypothetical protein GCM10011398_04050 [Virgibacillus oceani]